MDGLEGLTRIGGGGLLVSEFLALPESEGFYFAGPELDFGSNVNGATGRSGDELTAAYQERYGESSTSAYLAHAYDATTILLRAIEEAAVVGRRVRSISTGPGCERRWPAPVASAASSAPFPVTSSATAAPAASRYRNTLIPR